MPTDTQLDRDLDSRVFRLGETLRTVIHLDAHRPVVMHVEPYAPPTVESIREGERRLSAIGDAPMGVWSSQVPPPGVRSPLAEPADEGSDFAELEQPMPGLRASLAIAVWQLLPQTTAGRVLLAVLTVPALAGVVALVAMVWGR